MKVLQHHEHQREKRQVIAGRNLGLGFDLQLELHDRAFKTMRPATAARHWVLGHWPSSGCNALR